MLDLIDVACDMRLDSRLAVLTAAFRHNETKQPKPWAVEYDNGETHGYSKQQMKQMFGLTHIQPGTSVSHKLRGHGIVVAVSIVESESTASIPTPPTIPKNLFSSDPLDAGEGVSLFVLPVAS